MQILRDFALLQTQMRHYDALIETRTQLLQAKPTNPPFWIGLAIAYQLVGKYDIAIEVLEAHESALREMAVNFEHSELLMYHNSLLEESGDIEKALEHLHTIEPKVCDKRSLKEKRAQYLLKLNKLDEAESAYRHLISENPDSYSYIKGLIAVKGLNSGKTSVLNMSVMQIGNLTLSWPIQINSQLSSNHPCLKFLTISKRISQDLLLPETCLSTMHPETILETALTHICKALSEKVFLPCLLILSDCIRIQRRRRLLRSSLLDMQLHLRNLVTLMKNRMKRVSEVALPTSIGIAFLMHDFVLQPSSHQRHTCGRCTSLPSIMISSARQTLP
jgi:tetratricopeptide (TPR) repeat protein